MMAASTSTATKTNQSSRSTKMAHPDLPVTLQHELRGLLTIEDEHLELLQLSADGKRASCAYPGTLRRR
jgi:hypothetical protein